MTNGSTHAMLSKTKSSENLERGHSNAYMDPISNYQGQTLGLKQPFSLQNKAAMTISSLQQQIQLLTEANLSKNEEQEVGSYH
jgi:hypothetical protein